MGKKVSAERNTPPEKSAKPRAFPGEHFALRLTTSLFAMTLGVFALYCAGAVKSWPEATLGFLVRTLFTSGALTGASALLAAVFELIRPPAYKRRYLRGILYIALGAAGLALGALGGSLQVLAAGKPWGP
jgi:MFS family permease